MLINLVSVIGVAIRPLIFIIYLMQETALSLALTQVA